MARDNRLRHTNGERPSSGRFALPRFGALVSIAAILAVLAAALVVAVHHLVGGGAAKAHPQPAFVTNELGAPQRLAPLVRRPVAGTTVAVQPRGGYAIHRGQGSVAVATAGAGTEHWRSYRGGLTRPTPFGRETVVVDSARTEQYLTVNRHQGRRTWSWKLATDLRPQRLPGGGVAFAAPGARTADLHLLPVSVLSAAGTNVAPAGLAWTLRKTRHGWWLGLTFDDSKLPVPYTIDPSFANGSPPPQNVAGPLGQPIASAASTQTLAPVAGLNVSIDPDGYSVTQGSHTVGLTPQNGEGGSWAHYENGTARVAPYGLEAVLVDGRTTEQYLVVTSTQGGTRWWTWQIDSGGLTPPSSRTAPSPLGRATSTSRRRRS
jgi:hypothetical protein